MKILEGQENNIAKMVEELSEEEILQLDRCFFSYFKKINDIPSECSDWMHHFGVLALAHTRSMYAIGKFVQLKNKENQND